ncbi:MAG: hypothetical protein IPN76_33770 [Saprospiraceae bacterium]|nr:hypothetical protein [Saprospiraceae bacterium]
MKTVIAQLQAQSYLEASVDSTHRQDSILTAWLHVGPSYEWASIRNGNVPDDLLNRSGFPHRCSMASRSVSPKSKNCKSASFKKQRTRASLSPKFKLIALAGPQLI